MPAQMLTMKRLQSGLAVPDLAPPPWVVTAVRYQRAQLSTQPVLNGPPSTSSSFRKDRIHCWLLCCSHALLWQGNYCLDMTRCGPPLVGTDLACQHDGSSTTFHQDIQRHQDWTPQTYRKTNANEKKYKRVGSYKT